MTWIADRIKHGLMEHDTAVKCLAELGNTTRLAIFRYLVKAGSDGVPVGSIQRALKIPPSTLSHHLGRLVHVGLIQQRRESRILYCQPVMAVLDALIEFLKSECALAGAPTLFSLDN